jgi:hypothetical protein
VQGLQGGTCRARISITARGRFGPRTRSVGCGATTSAAGAGRARCRGTAKLQVQLLLAATAINLKRLISRNPAAENVTAGEDHAQNAPIAIESSSNTAHRAQIAAHLTIIAACLRVLSSAALPTSTTGS